MIRLKMAAMNGCHSSGNLVANGIVNNRQVDEADKNLNAQSDEEHSFSELEKCTCGQSAKEDAVREKTLIGNDAGGTRKRKRRPAEIPSKSASEIKRQTDSYGTTSVSACPRHGSVGFWHRNLPSWCFEPEYMVAERGEKIPHVIHQNADSLFSTSSGFTNYRGLLNLCIILLALSNARLFLENIIKYGILIDPVSWSHMFVKDPYSWPNILILFSINIFILISFLIEKLHAKGRLPERVGMVLQTINIILILVYPATVVYIIHANPLFSVNTLGCVTMVCLKLISYHCVNRWCRDAKSQAKTLRRARTISSADDAAKAASAAAANEVLMGKPVHYPDNLNLKDLYYFMFAPTLCYELNFARSARIRKRFLLKRAVEILFLWQLMLGLIQQWVIPTLNNSMQPLEQMNIFRVLERLLKLAIPNHFIWLIFFYWFFHSILNALAEVLRFGDRVFYHDWWNAETVSDFWKNWNIPVHRWASRHLYKPMLRNGFSKMTASVSVFFVSAFFHEYLLSIPLRMFKVWAFSAMLGQVPLALFAGKYLTGKAGNMVVWMSLIVGQPIAILAYVHDYYIINVGTLANQTITIG